MKVSVYISHDFPSSDYEEGSHLFAISNIFDWPFGYLPIKGDLIDLGDLKKYCKIDDKMPDETIPFDYKIFAFDDETQQPYTVLVFGEILTQDD